MDSGFWLTMLMLAGGLIFAFGVIYLVTNKLSTEKGKAWMEEMDNFRMKHPVWSFLYTYMPYPLGLILQLVGPKPPKFPTKDE
tara:strand:+ start:64 stop:312 length:249 start_codon:yes stop_codon:yes gene_type:complete